MGHTYSELTVLGLKSNHDLKNVLVDTGATYTSLPKELITEAEAIPVPNGGVTLELPNGIKVQGEAYAVMLQIGDRKGPAIVVTYDNAPSTIGVQTLEALGLKVNPVTEELEETRPQGISYP